ncbi:MAG: hypothetical protein KF799_01280 [Bdellovibrionales bacterium]|nr:hypothetical protein [Bdellovibrionales bacterium]
MWRLFVSVIIFLFTWSTSAAQFATATEVDQQALEFFSFDEWQIYLQALNLVRESPLAGEYEATVYLTTSDAHFTEELLHQGGAELGPDTVSFSFEQSSSVDAHRNGVVIFWDQIAQSESPQALLILALAREILGSVAVDRQPQVKPQVQFVEENIHVLTVMLKFLRQLPLQERYALLDFETKAYLQDALASTVAELRSYRAHGRKIGACAAFLVSQDN